MPKREVTTRSKTQQKAAIKQDCRPNEPTSLGQWNREKISSWFQNDSKVCLNQSLFEACNGFFFPRKLEEIAKLEMNHELLNLKDDNNKKKLILQVGTIQALDENSYDFNYSCQSRNVNDLILTFCKQRFKKSEHQYIEQYLKDEKIIHLLLFNRYLVQPRSSGVEIEAQLIGVLSFRLVEKSAGYIVYFGIHDGGLQLDKVQGGEIKLKKNATNQSMILHRSFYLGTFMI